MLQKTIPIELTDGSSTKINIFSPDKNKDRSLIICFPAMGVKAAYYDPFAKALIEKGYQVITADLRGLGHSSVRASRQTNFGYIDMLDLDYQSIMDYIKTNFPTAKKYMLGHSLGGQLAALYLSRDQTDVDGLILVTCCSVYYKGWKGLAGWRVLLGTQMTRLISKIVGYFPGHQLGFGGKEARLVIKDWSTQARTGKYLEYYKNFDFEKGLRNCNIPILAISIEGDELAPEAAVQNLVEKFHPESPTKTIHVKTKGTPQAKLNHFKWVRHPDYVATLVDKWIN